MSYYQKKQYLAQVNKSDKILGRIEKWEAHKKGVLHRGYTLILKYKNQFVLQHRKHPVFDGVFDFSFSSHQIYVPLLSSRATLSERRESKESRGISLQSDLTAIYDGLKREWNLEKNDLKTEPKFLKKIYYQAKDPSSDYTEHEIDYIYTVELKKFPSPNFDFAYGFKLVKKLEIGNCLPAGKAGKLKIKQAPWVKVILEEQLL